MHKLIEFIAYLRGQNMVRHSARKKARLVLVKQLARSGALR